MNANELAEEVETYNWTADEEGLMNKVAEMLRQQQTEIDSLKDKLNLANKSLEIIEGWTK